MLYRLCLVVVMIMSGFAANAQEDARWSLSYDGGVLINPVLTSNPKGVGLGRGSSGFSVSGEYYLPKRWNAKAGYFRMNMDYGDADRTMEGLHLGAKKYFVNPEIFIQPYVGAGVQLNWGEHKENELYESESFRRLQQTRNPRFSFVPAVGAELYIFSSVAFVIDYNFVMGINSQTNLDITCDGYSYKMADKGMYHYLGLGVKITFPFRFTSEDGKGLGEFFLNVLTEALDRNINDR